MSKLFTVSPPRLPAEVLSNIADALDAQQLYSCMQVSRAWHEPFRRALYRTVHITDSDQFFKFIKALETCKARGAPSYNLVKELYLSPKLPVTQHKIKELISNLHNMTNFSHEPKSWDYLHKMQVLSTRNEDDDYSPSMYYPSPRAHVRSTEPNLTHLHLSLKNLASICTEASPLLTSVTHLIIGENEDKDKTSLLRMTVEQIKAVHVSMPHLAHLRLVNVNLVWPARGNPLEEDLPVAHNMRTISFEDLEVDNYRWLNFWCDMYPNTEALRFMFRRGGTVDMDSYSRQSFLRMARELKSLKKYDISFYGHHIFGLSVLDISTIFQYNCTALEDINVFLPNSYESKQIKDTTIYRYQKSLVKLQIALENQVLNHDQILRPLITSCLNLKDLSLGYYGESHMPKGTMPAYEIDTFLAYCPQLLNLKLQNVNVQFSNKLAPTKYPLASLSMTSTCATSTLLQFVDQQCPSLKDIRLKRCTLLESGASNREITISTTGKNSETNDLLQISDKMGLSLSYVPKKSAKYNAIVLLYKQYLQFANAVECLA